MGVRVIKVHRNNLLRDRRLERTGDFPVLVLSKVEPESRVIRSRRWLYRSLFKPSLALNISLNSRLEYVDA